jgi:AcrR family transcriptional regulator
MKGVLATDSPRPLTRWERRKIKTKEKLFHAAVGLFKEKGFDGTSVEEITQRADVAKGTFFNYFPRKEALLAFLGEKRMEVILQLIDDRLETELPVKDSLRMIFDTLAAENERERPSVQFVLIESVRRGGIEEVERGRRDLTLTLQQLIARGQAEGEVEASVSARKAAEVLVAVYFDSLLAWLKAEAGYSLRDDLQEKLAIVSRCIVASR